MNRSDSNRLSSRRHFLRQFAFGVSGALLAGCSAPVSSALVNSELTNLLTHAYRSMEKPPMLNTTSRPTLVRPDPPIEVKIGQMLMLGFQGASMGKDESIVRALRDQHIGSVVLFWRNIVSPEQVTKLTTDLQSLATLPLLISVDQEGGMVERLREQHGFPPTFSHAALGRRNDLDFTHEQASIMGKTLAEVGINLNLAPVVDVRVNPNNPVIARVERSFSADPAMVVAHAEAFIDGHHAHGVFCTLKHFPGHGSSIGDTHHGFTDVTSTWGKSELTPFRELIGKGKVDAIMTAHIFNSKLDPDLPATLSPSVVNGLLRGELGYNGVVISDDIQMRGITDLFNVEKAFELAILAGVDIIAVANNLAYSGTIADRFVATVMRLLDEGVIDAARIDQSYQRVARLKGLA